jgi:hypothetical protein
MMMAEKIAERVLGVPALPPSNARYYQGTGHRFRSFGDEPLGFQQSTGQKTNLNRVAERAQDQRYNRSERAMDPMTGGEI